jgi:hypothetical protein
VVCASVLTSIAVLVALVLVGVQVQQRIASPSTPITYVARPSAVVSGHVWLQGASGWKDVTPAAFGHDDPVDGQFLSATLGWAVDVEVGATSTKAVVVYRTTDTGATWTSVTLPWQDEGLANLVQLQFVDDRHGFVVVGLSEATSRRPGFLFATSDGGATWTKLAGPYGGAIRFTTASDGWLVGGGVNYARNQFSVTHDGGRTWQDQTLAAPQGLELSDRHIGTPAFSSASDGVLAANFGSQVAFYSFSGDGALWLLGKTFPVAQADREALPIVVLHGQNGLTAIGANLYATADGGLTWTPVHASAILTHVQWLGVSGATTGWAVVSGKGFCQAQYLSRCNNETLLTTADGGATWTVAA